MQRAAEAARWSSPHRRNAVQPAVSFTMTVQIAFGCRVVPTLQVLLTVSIVSAPGLSSFTDEKVMGLAVAS
jgi:hypothetical protein